MTFDWKELHAMLYVYEKFISRTVTPFLKENEKVTRC
jgi:hypothetical protein